MAKDKELDAVNRQPIQTLSYLRLRLHDGGALVKWPRMLFANSHGY